MRSIRLHVDLQLRPGDVVVLPAATAEHALRVLRMRTGDELTLFNGDGHDYRCTIEHADKRDAHVRVLESHAVGNESPLDITLAQAIARGEKMDWIVQKATELGVSRIVPLHTERSEVHLDERRATRRLAHWQAVALAACEQCGRAALPKIEPPQSLPAWLGSLADPACLRLALLPQDGCRVRDLQLAARSACLAVGPEGGWGDRDLAVLRDVRFRALNLGPRVLRTETAGLAALAALQAVHGDG